MVPTTLAPGPDATRLTCFTPGAPFSRGLQNGVALPIHFDKTEKKHVTTLLLARGRELEHDILPSQTTVYRRKRVQLVLQRRHVFRVQDPKPALSIAHRQAVHVTYTFNSFEPSTATRVLLPTISVGYTRSSRIFSCTDVSVRLRGLFCLVRELRVGLLSIRR